MKPYLLSRDPLYTYKENLTYKPFFMLHTKLGIIEASSVLSYPDSSAPLCVFYLNQVNEDITEWWA